MAPAVVMGIVNVTPDSFSDGGRYLDPEQAIAHGLELVAEGASVVDVGGESTRPGAEPVDEAEERRRVVPVIEALAPHVRVSVDTRHASVAEAAIAAGATLLNDVSASLWEVAADAKVGWVALHMQGEPRTMQDHPTYTWAPGDVFDVLEARLKACTAAGIPRDRLAVDPGIGFGKNDVHNAQILDHAALYRALQCPLVIGASRKSFIGRMSRGEDAQHRLPGSLAAALHGVSQGAQILRVHDVAETRQALAVAGRINLGA